MAKPQTTTLSIYNPTTKTYTSPRPPIPLPKPPTTSITDFLFRNLNTHSNSPALIDPYTHTIITFSQLKQHITNLSYTLHHSFNISKYDVVLIFSPNSILFPVAFFAVTSLGAIVTTANPLYTVNELSHQISDSNPKLIITVDQLKDKVNGFNLPVFNLNKFSDLIYKGEKTTSFAESESRNDVVSKVSYSVLKSSKHKTTPLTQSVSPYVSQNDVVSTISSNPVLKPHYKTTSSEQSHSQSVSPNVSQNDVVSSISNPVLKSSPHKTKTTSLAQQSQPVTQNDVAAILYSSGTTGLSKGVVLTHRSIIATSLMVTSDQEQYNEGRSVFLIVVPLFHVMGLITFTYSQLQRGNAMVVMVRFELEKALEAIERFRVTHLYTAPPVVVAMVKQLEVVRRYDTSSLKEIGSGAAPLGKDVMDECSKVFPRAKVLQGYGMTETGGIISIENSRVGSRHSGSSGTLCPGMESQIIHIETLEPLPPKQLEYFHNKEATEQTIDKQGWLHTGDLGYFDEEGRIYVVDRLKELIKYKGYQVAPAELEGLLMSHPEIMDAAVIPYTDEEAGEIPMAYVVRKAGSSLTGEEVQDFIAKQVAPFKRIRKVAFIDAIPKSAAGKILRRELRQKVQSKL
ncbi:hypothetical protein M8C21_032006 [Ambrosia artemisiifolia]|uniref:4-coumarate--CoA ligase n=1 Tax=Ambrosia artemisiifolia TaxID=4212 RepID=A0AAD5GSM2_AMBAR|nr:hypothetical protein M8C21_032006 [Ambrosia artemisiifolia]